MRAEEKGQFHYERVGSRNLKVIWGKGDDRRQTLVRVSPSPNDVHKETVPDSPSASQSRIELLYSESTHPA